MQQRRGTGLQWSTANPILASGEIGYESDSGEFRLGDGTNHWNDLSPFKNLVDLGGNLDDYVPLTTVGVADGIATLDPEANVPESQLGNALTMINSTAEATTLALTNDIATAKTAAELTAQGYVDTHAADSTNVHGITDTADLVLTLDARLSDERTPLDLSVTEGKIATGAITSAKIADGTIVADDIADGAITSAKILTGTIVDEDINASAAIAATKVSGTAVTQADTGTVTSTMIADGTILDADVNASAAIAQSKIADLTTDLAAKAPLAAPTFTGEVNAEDLILSGNLTVGGTTTTVNATDLIVSDPLIYIGDGNTANLVDLGIVSSFNDGTYQHSGLARDASDSKWKLFKGVIDEPTTVINFAQGSLDSLAVGAFEASSITVGTVSNTEVGYLDGVTSAIQTQIDTKSPKADPTFTGTVTVSASGVAFTDGTQVKAGVPSITTINQQSAAYTPVLTDRDKLVEVSSATAVTVTIPANATAAYPVGTSFDILQTGAGQITIAGAAGVTLNATPGLKLRTQWSSATLLKRATDTWVIFGDLSA